MEQIYETAQALLVPIWRGTSGEMKSKYRRTIWEQFENNIKSAAYTGTLSQCINQLCLRLRVNLRADDLATISAIVHSGQDRELLKLFRNEATTCVLLVRLENERRKEEWKEREAERQADESAVSEFLVSEGLFADPVD